MLLKNCLKCTFVSKKLNPIAVFLLQLLKFATVGYKYENISKKYVCISGCTFTGQNQRFEKIVHSAPLILR